MTTTNQLQQWIDKLNAIWETLSYSDITIERQLGIDDWDWYEDIKYEEVTEPLRQLRFDMLAQLNKENKTNFNS